MKKNQFLALVVGIFTFVILSRINIVGSFFAMIIGWAAYKTVQTSLSEKDKPRSIEEDTRMSIDKDPKNLSHETIKRQRMTQEGQAIKKEIGYDKEKKSKLKIKITDDEKELKEIMDEAYKDLLDIQRGYMRASHEPIRQSGERLFKTGVKIFEHLKKNPRKIRQSRRYLDYYLDMASKIMTKYITFLETGLESEETDKMFLETEKAMEILNDAFENQFTKLLRNDMMEVEANVQVLEQTFKMEDY